MVSLDVRKSHIAKKIRKLFNKCFRIVFCIAFLGCSKGYATAEKNDTQIEGALKKYDIIVIGSGGGTKLVKPVAKKGYKVARVNFENYSTARLASFSDRLVGAMNKYWNVGFHMTNLTDIFYKWY